MSLYEKKMTRKPNVLAAQSQWHGNITLDHDATIDALFHGDIQSQHALIIAKNAHIVGIVHAKSVEIFGTIDCYLVATDTVVVHKDAHVTGTIRCDKVTVSEGAHVAGLSISHCG